MPIPMKYTVRSLFARKVTTLLTALGMALVVFVFAATMMLNRGLEEAMVSTGQEDNVKIIRRSSANEVQSIIGRNSVNIIKSQPEVAMGREGRPLVSTESVVLINLDKRDSGEIANVTIRGVGPVAFEMREGQVTLVDGRMYTPGLPEVIVGNEIAERFEGCEVGGRIRFGGQEWTVVGTFEAGMSGFASEIWGDVELFMQAYGRPVFSSLTLRMSDTTQFITLKERLESDPQLTVEVWREREFYAKQTEMLTMFMGYLGAVISIIFSLGAIVGAMITMYAMVANRVTEIGTLRALGFRRWHFLVAFLLESMLLALTGGVLGVMLAALLQTVSVSTTNWGTFSEVAFSFSLTFWTVVFALAFSVIMGLVGGFLPAVRAARLKVVDALRAT